VLNCRIGSWDDAFGRPYPKGTQIAAMRRRRTQRLAVYNTVMDIIEREPETPIDNGLWERVAEQLNISAGEVNRLYYSALKVHGLHSATDWRTANGVRGRA